MSEPSILAEIFGASILVFALVLVPLAAWTRFLWPRTLRRRTVAILAVLLWLQLTAGTITA